MKASIKTLMAVLAVAMLLAIPSAADPSESEAWSYVRQMIESDNSLPKITVMIGDHRGPLFVHEKGGFTRDTPSRIWSSSKWISALAIMRLVERGVLSLDDKPSKYISYWTTDPNQWQSHVTLHMLLSFTSGYGHPEDRCTMSITQDMEACIRTVYDTYQEPTNLPGQTFVYGDQHLHIAGYMAVLASGKQSFQQIIDEEIVIPNNIGQPFRYWNEGGFTPAAGLYTTPQWYAKVLEAYIAGRIVQPATMALMETDHTPYPINESPGHYGYGHWLFCESFDLTQTCGENLIHHSGGWQGYFPFFDRRANYWGIFAHVGAFGDDNASSLAFRIRSTIINAVSLSRETNIPDNPKDHRSVSSTFKSYGKSVAAILLNTQLNSDGSVQLDQSVKLGDLNICPGQRYTKQPLSASCSGFLASANQIVTSGECIKSQQDCNQALFVFGYIMKAKGNATESFSQSQVYRCQSYSVAPRGHVVVTLDRPVRDRTPLRISRQKALQGERLFMIGHPNGLPLKYVESGYAYYADVAHEDNEFQLMDSNSFGDFTGAPVISRGDDAVVGVFVGNSIGYKYNEQAQCLEAHKCESRFGYDDCASNRILSTNGVTAFIQNTCTRNLHCSHNGQCVNGACVCKPGFFGSDCSHYTGLEICNLKGWLSEFGSCTCFPGYEGAYCDKTSRPTPSIASAPLDTFSFAFGSSVSGSGAVVAVGQPNCVDGVPCDGGIATLYYVSEGTPYPFGRVNIPGEQANANCGYNVKVSDELVFTTCRAITLPDGNSTAAILIHSMSESGAQYITSVAPPVWDTVHPTEGYFGASVDILDTMLLVGAPGAAHDGQISGAAYLYFMNPEGTWLQTPIKIHPDNGVAGDRFGIRVAISANAYSVEQVDWTRPEMPDFDYSYISRVEANLAIANQPIANHPSVYVYRLDEAGLRLLSVVQHGSMGFGSAIDLTSHSLLVGDPTFSVTRPESGAVFVYDIRGASQAVLTQTILPDEVYDYQHFGSGVAAYETAAAILEGATADYRPGHRGVGLYMSKEDRLSYALDRNFGAVDFGADGNLGPAIAFTDTGVVVGVPSAEIDYPGRGAAIFIY
eukprot:TRINITY_DN8411_c0_g1_i4.p1 TRINITY_DN8411_c0_g1~~TRINITY_DN8411_c0_g1_i4.p1  ORF type:complete len:1084 (+),score=217.34 TRINITY_DN8411_c0_g1_i4:108-3359(+)